MWACGGALLPRPSAAKPQKAILRRLALKDDDEGELARQREVVAQLLAKVRKEGFGVREGRFFPHTKSIAVPVMRDRDVVARPSAWRVRRRPGKRA